MTPSAIDPESGRDYGRSEEVRRVVHSADTRGTFSKPFAPSGSGDLLLTVREVYWSSSQKGVVRGMHLQLPPADLDKLVWVSAGRIVDVVVDLRDGVDFGRVNAYELAAEVGDVIFIPRGFAHGFQALTDGAIVNYATDRDYAPEVDGGVHWDSIGFDWPLPVTSVSPRDEGLPALVDFRSPFRSGS